MINIGIIGTAGRKDDIHKLDAKVFEWMLNRAAELIEQFKVEFNDKEVRLVSGGSSWSDHITVKLFNAERVDSLLLCLPATFWKEVHCFNPNEQAGFQSNKYHRMFSRRCFQKENESLFDVHEAIERGAKLSIHAGFMPRNRYIAYYSDVLTAFTFGKGDCLKDGGSAHTMGVFLAAYKGAMSSLHVNLNDKKTYRPAKVSPEMIPNQTQTTKPQTPPNCTVIKTDIHLPDSFYVSFL